MAVDVCSNLGCSVFCRWLHSGLPNFRHEYIWQNTTCPCTESTVYSSWLYPYLMEGNLQDWMVCRDHSSTYHIPIPLRPTMKRPFAGGLGGRSSRILASIIEVKQTFLS